MSTEQSNSWSFNVNKNGYLVTFTLSEEGYKTSYSLGEEIYRTYVCADFEAFRSLIYRTTGRVLESYYYTERITSPPEVPHNPARPEIRTEAMETRKEYHIPNCRIAYGVHILSSVPSVESR